MPVTQINPDFTSINEEVLFLTPHDRIIMPTAEEIPCSNFFATKFSTIDNEWIALTKTGIIKTTPPEKQIKWLTMDWKIKDDIKQISFDIDSGLYSFDKVEGFEKMLIHSAIKNSKVSKLVQPIKMNRATDMEQVIEPGDIFTTYPWNALKQTLINTLMIFGQYCSIIIGIYSIISIIRAIYVYVTGFCIARRTANGIKDLLNYAFSPTNFALTKLTTNNKKRDIDVITSFYTFDFFCHDGHNITITEVFIFPIITQIQFVLLFHSFWPKSNGPNFVTQFSFLFRSSSKL